jgi:hypothetical protein
MEYIGIFIDGGYLQKLSLQMAPECRIDMAKLVRWIACDLPVRRVYYYDCLPYQSPLPTTEERERVSRKQKFFQALEKLDRFEVRLGRLEKRGADESGKLLFDSIRRASIFRWGLISPLPLSDRKYRTPRCFRATATFALRSKRRKTKA